MNNNLCSWLYVSRPQKNITYSDVQMLLTNAYRRNMEHDLSGIMVYDHLHFIQYLEGDSSIVDLLKEKICSDSRHYDLHTLHQARIKQRQFSSWNLSYISIDTYGKLFPNLALSGFNPYMMDQTNIMNILKKIHQVM